MKADQFDTAFGPSSPTTNERARSFRRVNGMLTMGIDNKRDRARLRALEWAGCLLGLTGALVLATNTSVSRYGWIAFLAANFALIGFARGIRAHGLLLQQVGFTATSVLGIMRAFWPH